MMNGNIKLPSFYMNILNGILLFFALYILYANFNEIKMLDTYKLLEIGRASCRERV